MHSFFEWLQNLPVFVSIAGSESIWSYPTILMLHTVGLGWLVGLNTVVALRLLGVGKSVPFAVLDPLFPKMWWGFWLNLVTGLILFSLDADHKAFQWIYWAKLSAIALALMNLHRTRVYLNSPQFPGTDPVPFRGRRFAWVAIILWVTATTTGRLMAYVG